MILSTDAVARAHLEHLECIAKSISMTVWLALVTTTELVSIKLEATIVYVRLVSLARDVKATSTNACRIHARAKVP